MPSGIVGTIDCSLAPSAGRDVGSFGSRIAPQRRARHRRACAQARAVRRPRRSCAVEASSLSSTAVCSSKVADVAEVQVVELDESPDEQQRRVIAVVDGGKRFVVRSQVGKQHVVLVPVLERQFAFDAAVSRRRDGGDRERAVVERITAVRRETLSMPAARLTSDQRRHRVLGLGVRQPAARRRRRTTRCHSFQPPSSYS